MARPSYQNAEEIYREAQKELKIASDFYSKVYQTRRHYAHFQMQIPPGQKKKIEEWSKESSKHRRKHKALMAKIKWDSSAGVYRMR